MQAEDLTKTLLEKAVEHSPSGLMCLVSIACTLYVRAAVAELKAWIIEREARAAKEVPTLRELSALEDRVDRFFALAPCGSCAGGVAARGRSNQQ